MKILSMHTGGHDGAAALFDEYKLLAAVQQERLSRKKGDGAFGFSESSADEVLDIAGLKREDIDVVILSRASIPTRFFTHVPAHKQCVYELSRKLMGKNRQRDMSTEQRRSHEQDALKLFNTSKFAKEYGFRNDIQVHFANHHKAHALSALFFTDWDNALIYTSDGGGDNINYSHRILKDGKIECLFGDESTIFDAPRVDSLGLAYGYATQALGYRMNRHEGKLTGLAGWGKPTLIDALSPHFSVDENGVINSDYSSYAAMQEHIEALAKDADPKDVAASIQQLLEDKTLESVQKLVAKTGAQNLALAGGVFANVRLNRLLCEQTGVKEVFICPAMGDEGLTIGGALDFLLKRDGENTWLNNRYRLENMYFGRNYTDNADDVISAHQDTVALEGNPVDVASTLLSEGKVVAIYTNRMEFGPRALGARTIMASPKNHDINNTINQRLQRTEFMPFAPFILEEDARDVFGVTDANAYACKFMTITTSVAEKWQEKIEAVVHIDGTARPQVITREDNPLYADILTQFKAKTGLPTLVNTSFNAHEEPIINKPEECLRALVDDRVDYVVTQKAVYGIKGRTA